MHSFNRSQSSNLDCEHASGSNECRVHPCNRRTFSSVPFGTASANRVAAVCVAHNKPASRTVTDVKIGGVSATAYYTAGDGIEIFYRQPTFGTTANVDITMNFGPNWLAIVPGY